MNLLFSIVIIALIVILFIYIVTVNKQKTLIADISKWHRLALTDHLTQIPNRAAYTEHMQELGKTVSLKNETVALLLIDINRFKKINDTKGHAEGDKILKRCARALERVFVNKSCNVFRIGGDEFAVIIKDMDAVWLERKIKELEQEEKEFTLSAGYAFAKNAEEFVTLFERADSKLYECKSKGL